MNGAKCLRTELCKSYLWIKSLLQKKSRHVTLVSINHLMAFRGIIVYSKTRTLCAENAEYILNLEVEGVYINDHALNV